MKILHVTYSHLDQKYSFGDHALADAAYLAIKSAMEKWRDFSNERDAIVSVKCDGDGEASFRVGAIAAVDIWSLDADAAIQHGEWAEFLGKLDGRREAARKSAQRLAE